MSTDLAIMPNLSMLPVMSMEQAVQRYEAVLDFTKRILKEGKDYGTVPGTDKPTLLKPGAEKLNSFFGFTPKFSIVEKIEDWAGAPEHGGEPLFYYFVKCQIFRGTHLVAEGDGSCNSRESKYRYRWVQETNLPPGFTKSSCIARGGRVAEFEFAVEKAETTGKYGKPAEYWQRFKDAIASGTAAKVTRPMGKEKKPTVAWEIDSTVYRIPNPEIADQVNTILKIAEKRSLIAASLIACNASEFYTQDLDDLEYAAVDVAYTDVTHEKKDTEPRAAQRTETRDDTVTRRIAEEQAKLDRQNENKPATTEWFPAGLKEITDAIKDQASCVTAVATLRYRLGVRTGGAQADVVLVSACQAHGMKGPGEINSTKKAKLVCMELWNAILRTPTPEGLANLIKAATDKDSIVAVTDGLLEDLVRKIGEEAAAEAYKRLQVNYGRLNLSDAKHLDAARLLIADMWHLNSRTPEPPEPPAEEEAAAPFQATDDDLPEGMFSKGGGN